MNIILAYFVIVFADLIHTCIVGKIYSSTFKDGDLYKQLISTYEDYPEIPMTWYPWMITVSLIISALLWPVTLVRNTLALFKKSDD